jgi:hypothetical protein
MGPRVGERDTAQNADQYLWTPADPENGGFWTPKQP